MIIGRTVCCSSADRLTVTSVTERDGGDVGMRSFSQALFRGVNLILFTVLLVHLILRASPHHSHNLRSHHLSLPRPFTPDLKLISFINPFLRPGSVGLPSDLEIIPLRVFPGRWMLHKKGVCILSERAAARTLAAELLVSLL